MPYADPERKKAHDRAYGKAHATERDARVKTWVANNPERTRAGTRKRNIKYRAKHREECLQRTREWAKAHPDKKQVSISRRRARQVGAPINDLTAMQWLKIKEAYGLCCVYCGKKQKRLTKDHIIPLSKGGDHTAANIVPACRSCNSKKGAGALLKPIQALLFL